MTNEIPFSTISEFAAATPAELQSVEGGIFTLGALVAGAILVGANYVVTKAVVDVGLEVGYGVRELLV